MRLYCVGLRRYRAGSSVDGAIGEELFSAPAIQSSLGTSMRHQTQEALRKRLAPVKAVQLACRLARVVLAGAADAAGDEAVLDLVSKKEQTKDYTMPPAPPQPTDASRAYTAPPPSPRFMVRAGASGGNRQRALSAQ